MWQRDWSVELQEKQHLPVESRLPLKVKKRLLWQAYSEMTYLSHRGRTLERTGKATLSVPWSVVEAVAADLPWALARSLIGRHPDPVRSQPRR